MCDRSVEYSTLLKPQAASTTTLTKFAPGEAARREDLRSQADKQGIGQVIVAPRDTAQQGNVSERGAVTNISRQNAEIQEEKASSVTRRTICRFWLAGRCCREKGACTWAHGEHEIGSVPGQAVVAGPSKAPSAVERWLSLAISHSLDKIGFKRICVEVGVPTPPFVVLSEEDAGVDLSDPVAKEECVAGFMKAVADINEKGLIKSIHGGGGKGLAHLDDPSDPVQVRAAIKKVLVEMKRSDGIYFEQKVNSKGDGRFYQLELEVDGETCAQGCRFVWFNSRLQKVVEIGLHDDLVGLFMPKALYMKSREWASVIAKKGGNNTRATMEGLVFQNEKGEFELEFIECNRHPRVENEALALLQRDEAGIRRCTSAEPMLRASHVPAPTFEPTENFKVVLHTRWLHGNPNRNGNITNQAGNILGMSGPRLDSVPAWLLASGEISLTSDPQLGNAVITANSWEEMCDRAAEYLAMRKTMVTGSSLTYAQTMFNLFTSPEFRVGKIASNETFKFLNIPEHPPRGIVNEHQDEAVTRRTICRFWLNGRCRKEAGACTWAHGEHEIGSQVYLAREDNKSEGVRVLEQKGEGKGKNAEGEKRTNKQREGQQHCIGERHPGQSISSLGHPQLSSAPHHHLPVLRPPPGLGPPAAFDDDAGPMSDMTIRWQLSPGIALADCLSAHVPRHPLHRISF